MSQRTLAIGTSSPALSVALFEGQRLIAHDHRLIGRGHAEAVVPAVEALAGRGRADAIVVDIGPGSFTGIRVGIAAARALGLAWRVPVHGVSAVHLAAAAAFASQPGLARVTILLDAGRGQILRQSVAADFSTGPMDTLGPDAVSADGEAVCGAIAGAGVLLLADAAGRTIIHEDQPDLAALFHVDAAARSMAPQAIYVRPPDATPASVLPH